MLREKKVLVDAFHEHHGIMHFGRSYWHREVLVEGTHTWQGVLGKGVEWN